MKHLIAALTDVGHAKSVLEMLDPDLNRRSLEKIKKDGLSPCVGCTFALAAFEPQATVF